jgi:DNA-binding NarL/FixJ family response regulator
MIAILVVEDHPFYRSGIVNALNESPFECEVYEAADGEKALNAIAEKKIDLILMDINLPGMNGIQCTQRILRQMPEMSIVALTSFEDKYHIEQMVDAGAKGYLLKSITEDELHTCISNIINGKKYYSPELFDKMLQRSVEFMKRQDPESETESPQDAGLGSREKQVLKLIYEEYSTSEIAEKMFLSEHTVNMYRKSLLAKTGSRNVVGLVKYAFRQGWF